MNFLTARQLILIKQVQKDSGSHTIQFFFLRGGNEMNSDYKLNCEYFF